MDSPGPAYTLTGHRKGSSILSISWDGDKSMISGGTDGRLLLWSLNTGTKVALGTPDQNETVNQCLFASKTRILSGKNTGKCSIFDNKLVIYRDLKKKRKNKFFLNFSENFQ